MPDRINIAQVIDHTLLKPDATEADINKLCEEAKTFGFYSVCVQPFFIKTAKEMLQGTKIKLCTVVGFPLGMTSTRVKIFEAMESNLMGADELDIVINLGNVKTNNRDAVKREISDLLTATPEAVHKIIIETCYLSDDEKIKVSRTAMEEGAEFVKTSTGFAPSGAHLKDVAMIKNATKGRLGIKAAGGIKTLRDVLKFINAGASRIGTSSAVSMMEEIRSNPCKNIEKLLK
jgi:deoxyribose-phosphate aldolase